MSLADASFISSRPIDKIVRVFTGSYSSGDLTTRSGDLATPYVYRFAHDLPRPVACELIFSADGGTTWEDGGINKIAFSDSTYIYIFHGYATSGTPVQYKVYCSWIDDYDSDNPIIDVTQYTDDPVQFDSRVNYQKIAEQNVLTFPGGTGGSTSSQSIPHTLGYAPNAKVYFEAFPNEVWPLNAGGATNIFNYDSSQDECALFIYSNRMDIDMYRYSNTSKRAWYRMYYDAN